MEENTIKINLSKVVVKKEKKHTTLDGYIEINPRYLYFFKNTWIKYTDKQDFISYPGGNLFNIESDSLVLKNIKGTVFELTISDYIFYCREASEQYKALQEILLEKEKLELERRKLQEEKNIFTKQKREFFLKYKIKDTV